jgi:hypothetical protein
MRTEDLLKFMLAREEARAGHHVNARKPWTYDKIIQRYRFCNVRREDDKVTKWIKQHWRDPYGDDPNVWFLMVVARLVNWPETLGELTFSLARKGKVQWDRAGFLSIMHKRKADGLKVFSGAYIVSTNGRTMDKAEYLAAFVLDPLWAARKEFAKPFPTLAQLFHALRNFNGMGSFMAAQVVADVKFTPPYTQAVDWWDFAAPGPGSQRGLNRVYDRPVGQGWPGDTWHAALAALHEALNKRLTKTKIGGLPAQDIQNCLCEFDKYERVRLGEGKPRSSYPGVK